jgi:hypothetical protein
MAKLKSINRIKSSYPQGTKVYCWKFCHPQFGWVGGGDDNDWSENRGEIEARMKHCEWDAKLIEGVA